jgi:IS30 family transposase
MTTRENAWPARCPVGVVSVNSAVFLKAAAQTISFGQRAGIYRQGSQGVVSRVGVKTLHIEPMSPWENGYNDSFNGKLRDELLNGEIFYTLKEAQILIERCGRNTL